jgi:cobalt-zinc-cadmium efflux system membrane fusion protein
MHQRAFVFLICLLPLGLAGCGGDSKTAGEAEPAPPAQQAGTGTRTSRVVTLGANAPELSQMKIEPVRLVDAPLEQVTAPAKIEANPNRIGRAVLPAAGRIAKVMVKLGDSVRQGDPMVSIESSTGSEAEAAYTQATVSVRQADVAIAQAEADLSRVTDLFQHKAVAQKEVISAQTALALAKASREQALSAMEQSRRKLELLGLKPGDQNQLIVVRAPISGKVLEVSVVGGEFVNEINVPLVTIADLSRVWATSEVPESEIRHCRIGGFATLDLIAFPKETFKAKVTRIADTVDSDTRTIKVSAELDNAGGRLRPEMFGSLRYDDSFGPTPWAPAGAIVRIDDKDYVFIEQSPGKFALSVVELGRQHEGGFIVSKGLEPNVRIVTQGSIYLKAAL